MRYLIILLVLMSASVANAHVMGIKTRVKSCDQNKCSVFYGNATCVFVGKNGTKGVYLTAAHVVRNTDAVFISYRGRWNAANVVVTESDNGTVDVEYKDLAVLETDFIPNVTHTVISTKPLVVGEAVTRYGYARGSPRITIRKGRIVNINGNILMSTPSVIGDSGGPIFNSDNELIGIVSGNDGTPGRGMPTIFSGVEVIETCFIRAYGRVPFYMRSNRKVVIRNPENVSVVEIKQKPVCVKPKPDPLFIDNSKEIQAIEGKIASLQKQIKKLGETKIPVQIIGNDNKILSEQKYLLGDPIKLRFKAVKKSEAK